MSISSDSAELVMKIMLEGEEICLKATGKAAIEILKYVAVFLKSHQQTQGKTKLINLVKSGKQLDFFGVKDFSSHMVSPFCNSARKCPSPCILCGQIRTVLAKVMSLDFVTSGIPHAKPS